MRLCIVTHTVAKGDGQGRVNYEVAWEAIRRGHEVTLLASRVAPELQTHPAVKWVTISVHKLPTTLLRELAFARRSAAWLQQHRSTVDVVKVNGAISWWTKADVNAVHFVHSAWLRSPHHTSRLKKNGYGVYQWLYTALNANWEIQAFQRSPLIIAVSEKVKQELSHIGVPQESIRVILNGVDTEEFYPHPGNRAQLGLPENVPIGLFIGDIRTPRKNLDSILQALVKTPNLHLAVVGSTQNSPYPQLAKELNLAHRVHFLDYRRDVSRIMQATNLFVFPSRYEACTLVLLEAMASGLPVITANTTGGSEIVTEECGIVLQDSENIEELAKALSLFSHDLKKSLEMGNKARQIAINYHWKNQAGLYLELFEQIAAN